MQLQEYVKPERVNEIVYEFKTDKGTMRVKPSDIIQAMEEQSKVDPSDICPPDEDLQGWSLVYAKDEAGASRPLLLMRYLPGQTHPLPYSKVENDDRIMEELVMKKIYKLSYLKIKWLRFKKQIKTKYSKVVDKFKRT